MRQSFALTLFRLLIALFRHTLQENLILKHNAVGHLNKK